MINTNVAAHGLPEESGGEEKDLRPRKERKERLGLALGIEQAFRL